jgi:uracil-DNA glycosylase
MSAEEELQTIATEVSTCTQCKLHAGRLKAVPGEGPANAELMFIGEGPGFHEDQQGRPFVGAAGKFLEELLAYAGYRREQVFIGNVVKCRPPGNRDPEPDELQACSDYLERQIAALNPRIIVTLGRYSMARFFPNAKISAMHGQARQIDLGDTPRIVVAMFHPAAALHQQSLRATVVADFKKLPEIIARARAAAPLTADDEPPQQMSMF